MRKVIFVLLIVFTLVNTVMLVIALTQPASSLYPYRMVIGLCLLMVGGLLRRHILRYNETDK